MASASATPSSGNLQLIEGNSDGEHRPVPSTIARARSLESTSRKYKRRGNGDTTNVPLHERVKQFPGENLIVREGKLFCSGCREIISSKKSVLKIHISSKKHHSGKEKLKKSKLKDQTIIETFRREGSSKDSTLPVEECAYRLEVVSEFLKAGIPIGKIDMLRSLLEKNGYRLTGRSHLGQYVSMALKQEIERIKQDRSNTKIIQRD